MKPWLYKSHSGYFYVVMAVMFTHFALAVDAFQPHRHQIAIFRYVTPAMAYYGYMHLLVGTVILACLYLSPRWWWAARAMFFVSVLTFNTFATAEFIAVFKDSSVSWVSPTGLIALSISSAAAWREPITGPRFRSLKSDVRP